MCHIWGNSGGFWRFHLHLCEAWQKELLPILKQFVLVTISNRQTFKVEAPLHVKQASMAVSEGYLFLKLTKIWISCICNVCSSVSISLVTLGYDVCHLVGCYLLRSRCNSVPDCNAFPTECQQARTSFTAAAVKFRVQISLTVTLSAGDTIKLTSHYVYIPNCIIFWTARSYFSRMKILLLKTHWISFVIVVRQF